MGSAEETKQQPAAERCGCGYLLKGLTEKRCPECGRAIPSGARRKWPYLLAARTSATETWAMSAGLSSMLTGSRRPPDSHCARTR